MRIHKTPNSVWISFCKRIDNQNQPNYTCLEQKQVRLLREWKNLRPLVSKGMWWEHISRQRFHFCPPGTLWNSIWCYPKTTSHLSELSRTCRGEASFFHSPQPRKEARETWITGFHWIELFKRKWIGNLKLFLSMFILFSSLLTHNENTMLCSRNYKGINAPLCGSEDYVSWSIPLIWWAEWVTSKNNF